MNPQQAQPEIDVISSPAKAISRIVERRSELLFPFDAALRADGPPMRSSTQLHFSALLQEWEGQIADERLVDYPLSSLYEIAVDPRDGAAVFDEHPYPSMAYTPHAWYQLVQLFRGRGASIPAEVVRADHWHSPLTRHFAFADVKRASSRPLLEEAVLRTFGARIGVGADPARVLRAVVSGRHSLEHTDDLAVAGVLRRISATAERIVSGRVARSWDSTFGSFVLDAGDPDVRFGFAFSNSETGCGSLAFHGSVSLRVLDAEIVHPTRVSTTVTVAEDRGGTRRRHTLPRKGLSEFERAKIAAARIESDVVQAMSAARSLAEDWARARTIVDEQLVPIARMTEVSDEAVEVLGDALLDLGVVPDSRKSERGSLKAFARRVAEVIASEQRLRSVPHGSRAHLAAALAVLAERQERWEDARQLQKMAGAVVSSRKAVR